MKNLLFILLFPLVLQAQALVEKTPPEYIKTIIFKTDANDKNQFPIVRRNESFSLQFDDIIGNEETYYYQLTHCNADWTPSQLLKSEYLKGIDGQPIQPEANSYGTLQTYSHYRVTFPNELTQPTLAGNYMLSITDSYGTELFSRRFILYTPLVAVPTEVKRARDMKYYDTSQVVQFSIQQRDLRLENPQEAVKVAILQNFRWDRAITSVKPQYVIGNDLVYKYDRETSFEGGNEYYYFDSKDLLVAAQGVVRLQRSKLINSFLKVNTPRANHLYTYYPDINGDFLIKTLHGANYATEADYTWVHFALQGTSELWNKEVYVYGKFSNYELLNDYKLTYDPDDGLFKGKVLLKQGFYNYKFATKQGNKVDYDEIGGNFYQTENTYLVIVYYRQPGNLYDEVIGIGAASVAQ